MPSQSLEAVHPANFKTLLMTKASARPPQICLDVPIRKGIDTDANPMPHTHMFKLRILSVRDDVGLCWDSREQGLTGLHEVTTCTVFTATLPSALAKIFVYDRFNLS